jgi:hypothetical protein
MNEIICPRCLEKYSAFDNVRTINGRKVCYLCWLEVQLVYLKGLYTFELKKRLVAQ